MRTITNKILIDSSVATTLSGKVKALVKNPYFSSTDGGRLEDFIRYILPKLKLHLNFSQSGATTEEVIQLNVDLSSTMIMSRARYLSLYDKDGYPVIENTDNRSSNRSTSGKSESISEDSPITASVGSITTPDFKTNSNAESAETYSETVQYFSTKKAYLEFITRYPTYIDCILYCISPLIYEYNNLL